jgi:ATP-dependent DNA helicase RecG
MIMSKIPHRFLMKNYSLRQVTMNRTDLQAQLQLKSQANFRERYLQPALAAGLIEMTIPDKPRSSKQKYRLTAKGKLLMNK